MLHYREYYIIVVDNDWYLKERVNNWEILSNNKGYYSLDGDTLQLCERA